MWRLHRRARASRTSRRADRADHARRRRRGPAARATVDHHHRRSAAEPDDHREVEELGRARPRLRPDRNLRPVRGVRGAAGMARARRRGRGATLWRARASAWSRPTGCASSTSDDGATSGRRRDDGRDRHARQQRHEGLLQRRRRRPPRRSRGGWFHSGDLGVMHPDGYVQLLDRAKDVVISGGENISTVEVEQALLATPRCGGRGHRRARRQVGRAAEGRRHEGGIDGRAPGDLSLRAASEARRTGGDPPAEDGRRARRLSTATWPP